MKKVVRLKRGAKELIKKSAITIAMLVFDIVLYHYLIILGSYVGVYEWSSAILLVGWFWLIAGQFGTFYLMWEE